jgi:hypothetical protein
MMIFRGLGCVASSAMLATATFLATATSVGAYPGGTPDFQTDVAPFCAACHSSLDVDALEGAGPRAEKELSSNKHLALILAGEGPYEKLTEADRVALATQIQAVDANSKIELVDYPAQVEAGKNFSITALVTGGAGPVVGVGLVDRAHRWYARPASSVGWSPIGPPTVIGPDGKPQSGWLERRPARYGRKLTFVNVSGVESDVLTGKWAKAKVIYTLRAPDRAGDYPLVGVYFFGTEKATALGSVTHPVYGKQPLGGYGGHSGRVVFTAPLLITVK